MWIMIAGMVAFLGSHLVPAFPDARTGLRERFGENLYRGLFTLVAIAGFVLIVWGYGLWRAEGPAVLYTPPGWMRHVTMLLMLPVFPLLFAAYLPGRIKATVHHPMITAVKLWAFAHLLANGDAASLVLFLGFLVWGVVDRISVKRREEAGRFAVTQEGSARNDAIAIILGLVVYALFVWKLHTWLIGVPVIL